MQFETLLSWTSDMTSSRCTETKTGRRPFRICLTGATSTHALNYNVMQIHTERNATSRTILVQSSHNKTLGCCKIVVESCKTVVRQRETLDSRYDSDALFLRIRHMALYRMTGLTNRNV